mgnify:CR=1 FL=1|jgi:uncharacterized membrane protein
MDPRRSDLIGAALLTLVLVSLVAILFVGAIPAPEA